MTRIKHNLQMYWPVAAGIMLFIPAAWRYYSLGMWEKYLVEAAVSLLGFASMLAPDEVSSWTGRYGWTYEFFGPTQQLMCGSSASPL